MRKGIRTPTISPERKALIVADWRTGAYSQRALAFRHDVSLTTVNKLVKGVPFDTQDLVETIIEAKVELANRDAFTVNAVNQVIHDRTRHLTFFNTAALENVRAAMLTPCTTQADYKARAETIAKAKDVVIGTDAKGPRTAVQINNLDSPMKDIPGHIRTLIDGGLEGYPLGEDVT